jgi:hypothetical protein
MISFDKKYGNRYNIIDTYSQDIGRSTDKILMNLYNQSKLIIVYVGR